MYLHLIDDNVAVSHFVHRVRLYYPEMHQFLVFSRQKQLNVLKPGPDLAIFHPSQANYILEARSLSRYKAVFVHNLTTEKSKIILRSPETVVWVWCIWGYDYYHTFPRFFKKLFLPYTRIANVILGKMSLSLQQLQYWLHPFFPWSEFGSPGQIRREAAARIRYTCNTLPHHSDVFQVVEIPAAHRFHLSYYSIEHIGAGFDPRSDELGPHILIGNSASNTSNHLDILIRLRRLSTHRKVVVILGYGSSRYRNLINFTGRWLFGKNYWSLDHPLPIGPYNQMLTECCVMIFNHRRAQAVGNILFGIWAGHKVYLREENPIYRWLSEMGVRVFSIQTEWPIGDFMPLKPEWRAHNRTIIQKHYSEEAILRDMNRIFQTFGGNSQTD